MKNTKPKENENNIDQTILKAAVMQAELKLSLQFKKNMLFFKENIPNIYKKYLNFKPKNQKVFFDTKGYINLINIPSQQPTYPNNPEKFTKDQVNSFIEKPSRFNMGYKKVETWNEKHIHLELTNQLLDKYESLPLSKNKATTQIMGFVVIIGCGLGYHIRDLVINHNVINLFIHDENKDSFYASFYTVDWEEIIITIRNRNGAIKLTAGEDNFHALSTMRNLSKEIGLFNLATSYVYLHTESTKNRDFFESYRKEFHLNGTGLGFFDDEQVSFAHTIENIEKEIPFFKPKDKKEILPPAILIGNGPSLDELENFIKENKNSYFLISCGSAINSLYKMSIKPDLHIEMERSRTIATWRTKNMDPAFLKDIPLLALNTISPETIALFKETKIAIKPNDLGGHLLKKELSHSDYYELPFCNPTVANCGMSFIGNMGFKEIYLAGVDLGMPNSNHHHSKHSVHNSIEKIFHTKKNEATADYTYSNDQYLRPGNLIEEVLTTNTLDMARSNIEYFLSENKEIKCYNPNNGIKINGCHTIKKEKLPTETKKINKNEILENLLYNNFIQIDKNKFSKNKIKENHINPIFKIKNNFLLNEKCENINDLHKNLTLIFNNLKKLNDKNLACYWLVHGSIQIHIALLYFYCSRSTNKKEFTECYNIGKEKYKELIEKIFSFIEDNPFEVDDSKVTFK